MLIIIDTAGSREKNIVNGTTPAVNNNPTTTNTIFSARSRRMVPPSQVRNQVIIARTVIEGSRTWLWRASGWGCPGRRPSRLRALRNHNGSSLGWLFRRSQRHQHYADDNKHRRSDQKS